MRKYKKSRSYKKYPKSYSKPYKKKSYKRYDWDSSFAKDIFMQDVQCYFCSGKGHYANRCPSKKEIDSAVKNFLPSH